MITEQGTIKVKTAIDANMQKELNSKPSAYALTLIIVGAIGVGIFLVLEIASAFVEMKENAIFVFLILFAVFLGAGIGLKVVINKTLKTVTALPKINEYEFFKDYFIIDQTMNGENIAHAKVYVNQITRSRESNNYLFFYIGAAAYPVLKSELTEAELNTLRAIFRISVNGGTVTLAAAPSAVQYVQPERPAEDPFDEFKN